MFALSSVIFLFTFCNLDVAARSIGRIVGGDPENITEIPCQLSLEVMHSGKDYYIHKCGAVIIDKEWALTAAHCVVGRNILRVCAGDTNRYNGEINYVEQPFIHEHYDNKTFDYDIALLKMKTPFIISSSVQPIRLAKEVPTPGTRATVSGWGRPNEDGKAVLMLQKAQVEIASSQNCSRAYKPSGLIITERMLCAGSARGDQDACKGDSGGPLVSGGELVGIVSWGDSCKVNQRPGVYVNVVNLITWIKSVQKLNLNPAKAQHLLS